MHGLGEFILGYFEIAFGLYHYLLATKTESQTPPVSEPRRSLVCPWTQPLK